MTITDPLAGTPLALAPTPDGMVGLGIAEMAYIASRGTSDAATLSRDFLGLNPPDDQVAFLGASALTARGFLTGRGTDELEVRSSAALLQIALGTATRWTRIGVLAREADPAVVYLVQTPELAALIEPAALASWWLSFTDDPTVTPRLITELLLGRLEANPEVACIVDSRDLTAIRHNLLVTRAADGELTVSVDVEPGGEGGTPTDIPAGGLLELVTALMTDAS